MKCTFREAVEFEQPASNTNAQCPVCGAYRHLRAIRHNGEVTEAYLFPTHDVPTRPTGERPSWRRLKGEYEKWSWHTVEMSISIVRDVSA